jgi:hypothetical protein
MEIIRRIIEKSMRVHKVKSSSADKTYDVYFDEGWHCSCPAIKECRHIKEIKESPIAVNVRKPFNGMVAIRDKYFKQAQEEGRKLAIICNYYTMTVKPEEYMTISKAEYQDKFSKEKHRLVYYNWNPDKRGSLFKSEEDFCKKCL